MTSYICIGKGKTDANGVAQLTHDCQGNVLQSPGYVGQGKGKLNVVASTDSPSSIGESSLVSETYEVIDAEFYDTCVTGSTATWVQNGTAGSNTLTDNGRVISGDSSGNGMFYAQKVGQTGMYCWNDPLTVEFDAVSVTGAVRFQTYSSSTTVSYAYDFTQTGHWKFVYDGTNITAYFNGKQQGDPIARGLTNSRIGFVVENGESITFKDFVVYPI